MTEAYLGYRIDSSQAKSAAVDLDKMAASADKADAGAKKLSASSKTAETATEQLTYAERRLVAAQTAETVAANQNTTAWRHNSAARMQGRLQTANLAAQFNDIGVMLAAGQSPMLLALQQGTQISQVLGPMGAGGAVKALGAGFLAMVNPISIVTIATIALGAAGFQALMGMMNQTEDATSALEKHSEWLDKVLAGYDDIKDAAQEALSAATKLPQGVVASDLGASLKELQQAADAVNQQIAAQQARLQGTLSFLDQIKMIGQMGGTSNPGSDEAGQRQIELLSQLGITANSTRREIDDAMTAARELFNTADDPAVRDLANEVYNLGLQMRTAQDEAYATARALAMLNNAAAQADVSAGSDKAIEAINQLKKLAPDLRDAYQKAADALQVGLGAPDAILRQAALQQYNETIRALDEQAAREEAKRASRTAQAAVDRQAQAYVNLVRTAQQRIDQAGVEAQALGMTAEATNRLRIEQEYLNKAANDNVKLTPQMQEELMGLASAAAAVEERTRLLTQAANDNARVWGAVEDGASGFFKALARGENALDVIGNKLLNISDILIDMAVRDLFSAAFGGTNPLNSIFGGLFGGGLSFAPATMGLNTGLPLSYAGGGYTGNAPRSGGVDGKGGFPAILHPKETVIDHESGGSSGGITITIGSIVANSEAEGAAAGRGLVRELKRLLPDAIEAYNANPYRRTG